MCNLLSFVSVSFIALSMYQSQVLYLRHYIANAFLTEVYKIINSLWSSGFSNKCHNSLYIRQAYFQTKKEALLGQYFLQSWNVSSALYSGFFLWSVCLGQKSFNWSRSKKAWAMRLPPELLPPSFPSALWYWKSHLKKKKGAIEKYPCPAGHISRLKRRILCLCQTRSSNHRAHWHCRAVTRQIMLGFGHWVPGNTWAPCTHDSASLAGQSNWVRWDHSQN